MPASRMRFSPAVFVVMIVALLLGAACNLSMFDTSTPVVDDGANIDSDEPALQAYFSNPGSRSLPEGITALVEAIGAAQDSVLVAMYNFTLDEAGEALLAAHQRGVKVQVVMESDALDGEWPQKFQSAGIPLV